MKNKFIGILFLSGFLGHIVAQDIYSVVGSQILKNSIPWEFVGTNNVAVFSLPYDYSTQQGLGMDISRECIDLKLTNDAALQSLVTSARNKGQVIILAGFWYDSDAFNEGTIPYPDCQLLGANPQEDNRWNAVMHRWKQIANLPFIKNNTDVWINPWNEPYYWDGSHGYSDEMWENDAKAMIDTIRNTGANNIIVIEGSHTGQGHAVIIERGQNVRQGRTNILFDIHAYNAKWNIPASSIQSRIQAIQNAGNALIISEFANNGDEVWQPVMDACRAEKVSLLAWLWGQYKEPFVTSFKNYCQAPRNTDVTDISAIENENFSVFPNPFLKEITLRGMSENPVLIEIYSSYGTLEYKREIENAGDTKLDLSFLRSGVYVLHTTCKNVTNTVKILKI